MCFLGEMHGPDDKSTSLQYIKNFKNEKSSLSLCHNCALLGLQSESVVGYCHQARVL